MKKSLKSLIIFTLILGLNGPGLLAIDDAWAFFHDTETAANTTFQAGTLDLELDEDPDFTPELTPGDSNSTTSRNVIVNNAGTLPFQYQINIASAEGTACNDWTLTAKLGGSEKYSGSITTGEVFPNPPTILDSGGSDDWIFIVDTNNVTGTCTFNLNFDAWQDNLNKNQGFTDTESLANTVILQSEAIEPGDVIINEVMWMGSTKSTADEWIELRNTTNHKIDIGQWEITNLKQNNAPFNIPANKTIATSSYLIISRYKPTHSNSALSDNLQTRVNGSISLQNSYNNNGQLKIKDANGKTIDQTPVPTNQGWPGGNNGSDTPDNSPNKSMERNNNNPGDGTDYSDWHSCDDEACNDTTYWDTEGDNYGTPKAQNLSEPQPDTPNIVLNEFLPNSYGTDNSFPEYIELYNFDSEWYDIAGYYIETADGTRITINTTTADQYASKSTTIKGNTATTGWMAITTGAEDTYPDKLGNASDTLTLYTDTGEALDSVTYPLNGDASSVVPEDKSIARIPDGIGGWVDPCPTPGGANKNSQNEENVKDEKDEKNQEEKDQKPNTDEYGNPLNVATLTAPVAEDVRIQTASGTPVEITLKGKSPTDKLGFVVTSEPSHGSLSSDNGAVTTYTPEAGYTGTDQFTFQAYNNNKHSENGWVYIRVADNRQNENADKRGDDKNDESQEARGKRQDSGETVNPEDTKLNETDKEGETNDSEKQLTTDPDTTPNSRGEADSSNQATGQSSGQLTTDPDATSDMGQSKEEPSSASPSAKASEDKEASEGQATDDKQLTTDSGTKDGESKESGSESADKSSSSDDKKGKEKLENDDTKKGKPEKPMDTPEEEEDEDGDDPDTTSATPEGEQSTLRGTAGQGDSPESAEDTTDSKQLTTDQDISKSGGDAEKAHEPEPDGTVRGEKQNGDETMEGKSTTDSSTVETTTEATTNEGTDTDNDKSETTIQSPENTDTKNGNTPEPESDDTDQVNEDKDENDDQNQSTEDQSTVSSPQSTDEPSSPEDEENSKTENSKSSTEEDNREQT